MHTAHKINTYLKEREILLQAEKTFFTFFNLTSKIAVLCFTVHRVLCCVRIYSEPGVTAHRYVLCASMYIIGYNDFDFFDKKELPRPEIDVKWDFKSHL
jgi:hypothetical protein